jgi:translation initiation factor 5B
MAPKKKGGKKQEDDWEAELGETAPGVDGESADQKPEDKNDEDQMGGGLLAALKKNRSKKAKKGRFVEEDFVEGEDPTQPDANGDAVDLASKAPEEATFDDEDDVFAGKPKKGKAAAKPAPKEEPKEEEGGEEGGRVKSKKEKEKEKKEREKQRKREQVGRSYAHVLRFPITD